MNKQKEYERERIKDSDMFEDSSSFVVTKGREAVERVKTRNEKEQQERELKMNQIKSICNLLIQHMIVSIYLTKRQT
jgi:hypothetical protein